MKKLIVAATALCLCTALPAAAADKYVSYRIKKKTPTVEGTLLVDGFSIGEIQTFVRKNCAGKVGDVALVGKPRKKRGNLLQKFKTTCSGGPAQRYAGAKSVTLEHELMPDGRVLTEMLYGLNGDVQFLQEYN